MRYIESVVDSKGSRLAPISSYAFCYGVAKGVMTIPVTRKSGVVGRSVMSNSSAPPALATVTCKASRADKPKVQAAVYAWVTSVAETGMRRALGKKRSYKG